MQGGIGIVVVDPHTTIGANQELVESRAGEIYVGFIGPHKATVVIGPGTVTRSEGVVTGSGIALTTGDGRVTSAGGIEIAAAHQ